MKKIPITRPVFDEEDREALIGPLKTGWVVQGPNVAAFEKIFSEFAGCRHSIASTSCTTALHLALDAIGIGPGDEVIVPSFTYVASANSVEYTGATPIFCDIDLDTFNIDPIQVQRILRAKKSKKSVKAIMPVHLFGLAADMGPISEMAREHHLAVIEDAACAIGTFCRGRHVGAFGDAGCFSFHPRKAITTGEGGMVTTHSDRMAARIRSLRDHGASASDLDRHLKHGGSLLPEFNMLGYNYRMTDFQGALGVSQMAKARWIIESRAKAARGYDRRIVSEIYWLIPPRVPLEFVHSYQSYVCRIDPVHFGGVAGANRFRNRFMSELEAAGISVRQGTHAVHTLGYYRKKYGLKDADFPNAFAADRLSITLPLYARMPNEDQDYVVDRMRSIGGRLIRKGVGAK